MTCCHAGSFCSYCVGSVSFAGAWCRCFDGLVMVFLFRLLLLLLLMIVVVVAAVAASVVSKRKVSRQMETKILEANLVCFANLTLVLPVFPACDVQSILVHALWQVSRCTGSRDLCFFFPSVLRTLDLSH